MKNKSKENGLAGQLVEAGAENFILASCSMGEKAAELSCEILNGEHRFHPQHPHFWAFKDGYFSIWRDSGLGWPLGRNRSEYCYDGKAKTVEEAIKKAGHDGIIVCANPILGESGPFN